MQPRDTNHELYRLLVENLGEGAGVVDLDERFVYANPAAHRIFGVPPGGLIGRCLNEFLSAGDKKRIRQETELRRSGKRSTYELEIRRPDGERRLLMVTAVPNYDRNGEFHGTVGVFWDITEARNTEEELAKTRSLLMAAVESSPAGIVIADAPDVRIRLANRAALTIRGETREALLDIPGELHPHNWQCFHPDGRPFQAEDLPLSRAVLEGATSRNVEMMMRRSDGEERWVLTNASPVRNPAGDVIAGIAVFPDVTERRRAEQSLAEREALYSLLANNVQDVIWTVDLDLNYTYISPSALRQTGYSAKELTGQSIRKILPPESMALIEHMVVEELKRDADPGVDPRRSVTVQVQGTRKDGVRYWADAHVSFLRDDSGVPIGILGVSRDVTERKRSEEELKRAKVAADAANRAKSQFLTNMSHEIRTPLNGIIGASDLLCDTQLDERQKELALTVRRSAASLLRIVDDLLDLSRIERGLVRIYREPFDLRAELQTTLGLISPAADSKGLRLRLNYPDAAPRWFVGDAGRIRQVILNLLNNAVKFTKRGAVVLEASFGLAVSGQIPVEIVVRDDGIGIPFDKHTLIFEHFTQLDPTPKRAYEGVGLGLSICRHLVTLMGGSISVDSAPGKGSVFRIALNLKLDENAAASQDQSRTARDKTAADFSGRSALLVEDNPVNQRIGVALLEKLGVQAEVAPGGVEAIEAFSTGRHDLIFMDCQMPGLDGFETTRRIRSLNRRGKAVPIVAITAHAMEGDRERCLEAGMNDYITKPVATDALRQALRRWLLELGLSCACGAGAGFRYPVCAHERRDCHPAFSSARHGPAGPGGGSARAARARPLTAGRRHRLRSRRCESRGRAHGAESSRRS